MGFSQRRLALALAVWSLAILGSPARASEVVAEEPGRAVLELKSEKTVPPCDTSWEHGSAPDAQHAWIDLDWTADAGRTWNGVRFSPQADTAMRGIFSPSDEWRGDELKSWFVTPERGWLAVPRRHNLNIWQTTDAGKTWRQVSSPLFEEFHFVDSSQGLALVVTPDHRRAIETTHDAGTSWNRCGPSYEDVFFDKIFLFDALRAWAVTAAHEADWKIQTATGSVEGQLRYGIMRTDDGGCHWHPLWSSESEITSFGDLYFIDEANGWLTGGYKRGLYRTSDGGRSWRPLPFPDEKVDLKGVFFRDLAHGWSISGDEQVYETSDGGQSWRLLPRAEILSRLDELAAAWGRWRMGKLYSMLARAGCFTPEALARQRQHRQRQ